MTSAQIIDDVIMHIPELWQIVLCNLTEDARSSIRLMRAVGSLYRSHRADGSYWKKLELSLYPHSQYQLFRRYIGHLGVRKRLLLWSGFCDAPCFVCKVPLFGVCCSTYAVGRKFCSGCRNQQMVGESELSRQIPIAWIACIRAGLRHSWLEYKPGVRQRYYLRSHVHQFLVHFHADVHWGNGVFAELDNFGRFHGLLGDFWRRRNRLSEEETQQ